jgi:hypothetical protein
VACPGGPYKTKGGCEAIRALSWAQVAEIVAQFARLNPYDRTAVPDSILKIEDDNFDPKTGKQRQLWCLAISAKRYVLFLREGNDEPELLRKGINNGEDGWSQHGLGHLLNPSDPKREDRSWIAQAWLGIVRRSLGLATEPLPFANRVALGQITVSGPEVIRPTSSLAAMSRLMDNRLAPTLSASISSRRMRPIRVSGSRCRGSISTRESSIGSARRSQPARGRSHA